MEEKGGALLTQLEPQIAGPTPMIMKVNRDLILRLVNEELAKRRQLLLPLNVDLTVNVPGGGDYSGMNLEIEGDVVLTFRWFK